MVKMAFFGALKWPKLISREIQVVEKSWNIHSVYSQLGCPGLYNIDPLLTLPTIFELKIIHDI